MCMNIELDEADARQLAEALALHLTGLRTELAHTDHRAYRAALRRDLECLERIAERLRKTMEDRRRPGRQPI